ncbi:MAG: ABC transporter permease [Sulfuricurvum sp. PD_MW2]|uniref:ABC transporter permease n=1 Tax=Sulfuricurvum sp. PD_MW2 TaxID=2027917 RepID=UPI000C0649B0|nr:FtsX-like permease family protein [Sulfuricurvum sp. PD_MW2]PHM17198.1 MAG: ABC transporter permease [Sulfuricurvum sp. PD_MW2]
MITPIKALRKNRFKTALIFISMAVSIAAIFLISAISGGVVSMYSSMLKTDGDIIVTQKGIADTFFSDINRTVTTEIARMNGVKEISALILGAAPVEPLPIVGIYGASENRFKSYALKKGSYPKSGEVMLGSKIYETLKHPETISLSKREFRVSGVFKSHIGFEDGGVVMGLEDAGEVFHKSASIFLIALKDLGKSDSVVAQINKAYSQMEAKTTDGFIDSYNQFKIIKTSSDVIGAMAFLMGILGIVSMMSMVVNDRKAEFGIMRSIGLSSRVIIFKLLGETLIIAVLAFIFALGASEAVLEMIKHADKFQGYINGEITALLAIKVFIISVSMALFGTLLPAIYAARIDPMNLIQRGGA